MAGEALPERAAVHWRPPVDAVRLDRAARTWTATTLGHVIPFVGAAVGLMVVEPLAVPVALAALAHAWVIPALYAQRGANVVRLKPSRADPQAERVSLGLLGDLVDHDARALHGRTGLVLERGRLGTWLVGPAGALLVRAPRRGRRWPARSRGGRVHCFCVRVDPRAAAEAAMGGADACALPTGDRIAHLLLALRADEIGFATVANQAFCGARWRVRRRLAATMRPALDAAARDAAARDAALDRGANA